MNDVTAIILAAGSGTRLGKVSRELPKCLQVVAGKALIDWQIETLNACGITNIIVATGFKKDELLGYGSSQVWNADYADTNMVYTLNGCLDRVKEGPLLVTYGDVLVNPLSVQSLIDSTANISILSDTNFLDYWSDRTSNPILDLETFRVRNTFVTNLGSKPSGIHEIQGQYMGLTHFSSEGYNSLRELMHQAENGKTLNAKPFKNAFMTDLLQELIHSGNSIKAIENDFYWIEVDKEEDLDERVIAKRISQIKDAIELKKRSSN